MKKGKLISGLASGRFLVETESDGSVMIYEVEEDE